MNRPVPPVGSEPAGRQPTVTGPIVGALAPFGAPTADVGGRGYVVEEYRIEGIASAYALTGDAPPSIDGRWDTEATQEAAYRTRILVVRPARAEHFNGTVVVNWQNVSAGHESGGPGGDEIFRGYAWVGVSAQEVGLYGFPAGMSRFGGGTRGLVEHDPERYGSLHHPGDPGSFDIFTQAARAVGPDRSRTVDPLGGLPVRRTIAAGGSQSAMRLVAYLNAVHPHARVLDGFLLAVWEGRAPRPEEGAMPTGVRTGIRTDHDTPVIVVNSEFETTHVAAVPVVDTEHLRVWEVAGTPHGIVRRGGDRPDERGRVANRLSYAPVHDAALRALHRWLTDGVAAPVQPRIEVDAGPRATIRRDPSGNALGGIRLPEMDAPTHEYRGMAFGTGRAPLFGAARPFSDEELLARYPDRATFTRCWTAAVDRLVASGALLAEDADAMKRRAADAPLPVDPA